MIIYYLNKLNRLLSTLLVPLLVLVGLGLPSGLVVCYGDDGHVAIEIGEADCNDEAQEIDLSQEHQYQLTENHCGSCTDIPLLLKSSEITTPEPADFSSNTHPLILSTSWDTLTSRFLDVATSGHLPQPPPIINLFLAIHRTVVLVV